VAALVIGCGAARAADASYHGMYFVSADMDNSVYLVESTTITTPEAGHRIATVYLVEDNGRGHIQSWDFRCSDLAGKLLSDHDYQHFLDNSWGENTTEPEPDFKPASKDESLGQVAEFACRWPKRLKGTDKFPPVPTDPVLRIKLMIIARQKTQ
jgi:hypothetical protein